MAGILPSMAQRRTVSSVSSSPCSASRRTVSVTVRYRDALDMTTTVGISNDRCQVLHDVDYGQLCGRCPKVWDMATATDTQPDSIGGWIADDGTFGARLVLIRQRMGWTNISEAARK